MALDNEILTSFFTKIPRKTSNGARVFDEPVPSLENVIKDHDNLKEIPIAEPETRKIYNSPTREKIHSQAESTKNNKKQIEDDTDAVLSYIALSGLQRKITNFIFNSCRYTRDRKTKPLSIENIAEHCNINYNSIKKTIQRLENKGIIIRSYHKIGRGGWTQYELPDAIYYEIVHSQTEDNMEINPGHSADSNKIGIELKTETSVLSADKNNSTKIESLNTEDSYPFDIEELAIIGFTQTHLQQILSQKKLDNEVIQQSIFAFAFDLNINGKAKKIKDNPLGYFMGILKKGIPYAPPANYEDPKLRGIRLYLEAMEQQKKKKEEIEQKIIEIKFDEWLQTITDEQKISFRDLEGKWDKESMVCRSIAKNYFKHNVWPTLKNTTIIE